MQHSVVQQHCYFCSNLYCPDTVRHMNTNTLLQNYGTHCLPVHYFFFVQNMKCIYWGTAYTVDVQILPHPCQKVDSK